MELSDTKRKLDRKFKRQLMVFFKAEDIIQYDDMYNDEFYVIKNGRQIPIEVVSRKVAVENELDFIRDIEDRKEFIYNLAIDEHPYHIGMYTRVDKNIYYREY